MAGGWTITNGQRTLFNPATVTVTRHRRRSVIPNRPDEPEVRRWRREMQSLAEPIAEAERHMAADQAWVDIGPAHRRRD
jgi:hypothetical protein